MKKLVVGLAAVVIVIVALPLAAAAQGITEFPIAVDSAPSGIVAGPDGAMWFTEQNGNKIGRITTAGALTEFPVPTFGSTPFGIVAGPDGALWFTENTASKIGRITTAGVITEFPVPTSNALVLDITAGPDGALWFTEQQGNKIGRITTGGAITEFTVPTANSAPKYIAAGPDGALWFTEQHGNKIGRITTAGAITEFAVPTADSNPTGIVAGPDGALWFTEYIGNKIGRITTSGAITEFPVPTANGGPFVIAVGPDGALWFTEFNGNKIGRIATTGLISDFSVPPPSSPLGIATGPDGAIWFTELNGNEIVRLQAPPSTSPLVAATLPASRSVQVGANIATAFALIINSGPAAINCGIAPVTSVPANFLFQTTDPNTNALTGTPNTRAAIAAGASQTFLVAFSANAPVVPTNVALGYDCDGVEAVGTITGVNTLLLTFSATPVPDMIEVGLTPSNDGYSRIPGTNGTGIFVIAATNIGAGGELTARATPSDAGMPLTTAVCQTDPNTGQCLAPPSPSLTTTIANGQNTTWTTFLTAGGAIAQDPARNRVTFEFVDSSGVVRGATSTAVTTAP